MFAGHILNIVLSLKLGNRPQHAPIPISQTAQDSFYQTELICKDARKNAVQAHIKCKRYWDEKTKAL